MKRIFPLLLILLITCLLASCGAKDNSPVSTETNAEAAATETAEEETAEEVLTLSVQKSDYNGYVVKYITLPGYCEHFKLNIESETGETLNDAGYKRERAVSELLNVEFDAVEQDTAVSTFTNSVLSGSQEFDFVLPHATNGVPAMVSSRVLLDWNEVSAVDFTKPWWNSSMQESLGINGKLFYASGDIVMTWQGMGAYVFNKNYLEDYNLGTNMYDLVYDGTWTVDKMLSLSKGMYRDLDGDTAATTADQYGILVNKGSTVWFQLGCEQNISKLGDDGCPVLDMGTERMTKVVEKYYQFLYSEDTFIDVFYSTTYATGTYRNMLISGRSFLTLFDVGGLYTYLREIEFDFGVLPMPKLNEDQENYHSFCGAGLIGIPINAEDIERTGKVAEALAYYSYQYVRPAFFDNVLQNKAVRDTDSYKILTMMHESKVFDFGFNFDNTAAGALDKVVVSNKSTDFASYYATIKDVVNANFRKIFDTVVAG